MGCSSDSPGASEGACANVATMYEEVTGSPPPSDCPCDLSLDRLTEPDGWDALATYNCFQAEFFNRTVPPARDGSLGSDRTLLVQVSNFTSARASALFGQITDDTVIFQCEYRNSSVSVSDFFVDRVIVTDFDFGDKIADFTKKYDACRGALEILVTKFPFTLGINNCTFD